MHTNAARAGGNAVLVGEPSTKPRLAAKPNCPVVAKTKNRITIV
jgi:hypothetical protein